MHIIGLIAEKKFFHFYAVLDTYITEHFSATLAYEYVIICSIILPLVTINKALYYRLSECLPSIVIRYWNIGLVILHFIFSQHFTKVSYWLQRKYVIAINLLTLLKKIQEKKKGLKSFVKGVIHSSIIYTSSMEFLGFFVVEFSFITKFIFGTTKNKY